MRRVDTKPPSEKPGGKGGPHGNKPIRFFIVECHDFTLITAQSRRFVVKFTANSLRASTALCKSRCRPNHAYQAWRENVAKWACQMMRDGLSWRQNQSGVRLRGNAVTCQSSCQEMPEALREKHLAGLNELTCLDSEEEINYTPVVSQITFRFLVTSTYKSNQSICGWSSCIIESRVTTRRGRRKTAKAGSVHLLPPGGTAVRGGSDAIRLGTADASGSRNQGGFLKLSPRCCGRGCDVYMSRAVSPGTSGRDER
ncbi:hypothetical protein Bbelb_442090 [Branchiostoma belcheri]|nr:hypothetical protein Bbelb_442090 [Branchiostoma belcheri]